MPSRRDVLLALAALAVQSVALPGANGQTPSREPTLRDLARRRGIMLGAQVEPAFLAMPEFASFVAANFDLITPGNQLKLGTLCARPQLYDFRGADVILEFALEH